jgi:hypothetical protein
MMIPWMRMAPGKAEAQGPDPGCRDCKGTGKVVLLNRIARCLCLDRAPKGGEPAAGGKPGGDQEGGWSPVLLAAARV